MKFFCKTTDSEIIKTCKHRSGSYVQARWSLSWQQPRHTTVKHRRAAEFLLFPSGASDFAEPASGLPLPQPALSWVWLVDLERTVALLVGRCLGGMLQGAPTSLEEQDTAYWLKTPLFSNGLEMEIPQLGRKGTNTGGRGASLFLADRRVFCCRSPDTSISSLLEAALSGNEEQKPFECSLHPDMSVLVDLALGSSKEPVNSLWINMQDYALSKGLLRRSFSLVLRRGPGW